MKKVLKIHRSIVIIIGIIVAAIIALIVIGMIRGRAVKNAEMKQA